MPTIVDALKAKYPDATGNTIDEVINTMDASGGSGGGGALNITLSVTTGEHSETIYRLDKTWREIKDAFIAGKVIIFTVELEGTTEYGYVLGIAFSSYDEGTDYSVILSYASGFNATTSLVTSSEDGYPEYTSI